MQRRNKPRALAIAVEIEREGIGDMDLDLAEHPGCLSGTFLPRLGQQFKEICDRRQAGAGFLARLPCGIDSLGNAEQRVRQAAPFVTDSKPCSDPARAEDGLPGRTMP